MELKSIPVFSCIFEFSFYLVSMQYSAFIFCFSSIVNIILKSFTVLILLNNS